MVRRRGDRRRDQGARRPFKIFDTSLPPERKSENQKKSGDRSHDRRRASYPFVLVPAHDITFRLTSKPEKSTSTNMKRNFLAVLLVALSLSGCAVQKKSAPQISAPVADALNLGTLVSNAQHDYITFFETVGTLEKQGALTAAQVAALNSIGDKAQIALNSAGSLCQTYAQTNSEPIAEQIEAYLATAAADYATMYQQKAAMLTQNSAAKAATASKPQ